MSDQDQTQGLNREQRRAQRSGPDDHRQDDLQPAPASDRASGGPGAGTEDASDTFAGGNRDLGDLSGAGTGGAVESDGRIPNHEGMHLGNDPNS